MEQSLSFTIPYTSSAIRATVSALTQMDNDLNGTVGLFSTPPMVSDEPVVLTQQHTVAKVTTEAYRDVPNCPTPPPPPTVDDEDELDDQQPEGTLDSAGTPWDGRIHSSSKATLKSDGTWKLKKGVDKALVAEVTAELMGNVDTTPTPSNVNTPPPPVEATIETPPPPAPVAETPSGVSPFRQLLADITKAGLAPDYVQTTCQEVNGCTLPQAKDDADKLAMLRMSLGL